MHPQAAYEAFGQPADGREREFAVNSRGFLRVQVLVKNLSRCPVSEARVRQ